MMSPLSLYELNSLVREVLELELPDTYWVQGELSEGRQGYGGHFYGELVQKDERNVAIVAKARVNCWANVYVGLSQRFREATGETLRAGMQVLMEVSVTFHQQYGYSLNILDIDPTFTLGDMARRRQQILRQLEADGILHDNQTLPMPLLTRRIAIVSSQSAAGYGDFCDQLENNDYGFHFHLQLFPAVMQGNRVEESIIAALGQIAEQADLWDVVVIIRGGGATSDLSDFDSYPLAACIAQMPLPVVTGIGHERDETVLDYVAHTHLKTPTAVASFLIDHMGEQAVRLDDLSQRIGHSVTGTIAREQQRLIRLATVLPLAFRNMRQQQEHRLERLLQRMKAAHSERQQGEQHRLERLLQRLTTAYNEHQQRERHRLDLMEQRLQSLDPKLLLQRGYSMTFGPDGRLLRDATHVAPGQHITTRLENGEVESVVNLCQELEN